MQVNDLSALGTVKLAQIRSVPGKQSVNLHPAVNVYF